MENFTPTHFIEQVNSTGSNKKEFHWPPTTIDKLSEHIEYTKSLFSVKTVAVFKIQLKKK